MPIVAWGQRQGRDRRPARRPSGASSDGRCAAGVRKGVCPRPGRPRSSMSRSPEGLRVLRSRCRWWGWAGGRRRRPGAAARPTCRCSRSSSRPRGLSRAVMEEFQAEVAWVALRVIGAQGFALAGAGALIAHGLVVRPTEDVDLFSPVAGGPGQVSEALLAGLADAGLTVQVVEPADQHGGEFARLEVTRGPQSVQVDVARDWRQHPPVRLAVGPVLHVDDAAARSWRRSGAACRVTTSTSPRCCAVTTGAAAGAGVRPRPGAAGARRRAGDAAARPVARCPVPGLRAHH